MVVCINTVWQLIRAWLPKFLQQGRGYDEAAALYFNSAYYIATDVGCLLAGALRVVACTARVAAPSREAPGFRILFRARRADHRGRGAAPGMAAARALAARRGGHPGPVSLLLLLHPGNEPAAHWQSRGSARHHRLVCFCAAQKFFGRLVDQTGSFDLGLAIIGWAPCVALAAMLLLWRREDPVEAPAEKN